MVLDRGSSTFRNGRRFFGIVRRSGIPFVASRASLGWDICPLFYFLFRQRIIGFAKVVECSCSIFLSASIDCQFVSISRPSIV
jgi:hypothetical protein